MTARRVEVRIDDLVLEGVRPNEAGDVGAAIERELARPVRERGAPERAVAVEIAQPAEIERRPGEAPAALGMRLAGAIYGRLGR
jgi:hypothetical protein